jgi:hypothetical protein
VRVVAGVAGHALSFLEKAKLAKRDSCCEMPEPCWMPLSAGEVSCLLRPGGEDQIALVVTNEGFQPQAYKIRAAGADASLVAVTPATFALGPKERRTANITIKVPEEDKLTKPSFAGVIWIEGCRNHYLRWQLGVTGKNSGCQHQLSIDDRPDYVDHWYDHFYCMRSCPGAATAPKESA